MIKKNEETGKSTFKKFSDFTKSTSPNKDSEEGNTILPEEDLNLPAYPNLPNDKTIKQKNASTRSIKPLSDKQDWDKEELSSSVDVPLTENKVKIYGKVAKLPKGTKASKGFNFLENVKISKSSIWYLIVEKQDNELQMVKYNYKKGVDLSKFINELKSYYKTKYSSNVNTIKMIDAIKIDGNDKYSRICNIPPIDIDGRKIITRITEDLIKLLSK